MNMLQKTDATDDSGKLYFKTLVYIPNKRRKKYFKEISVHADVKYIDPTYMIRACRANASHGILCTVLGKNAVHGAFAGFSGCSRHL